MEKKQKTNSEAIKEAEHILNNLDEKKRHFVILYDSFYLNKNLTGDEIALFTYLITRAPYFKPNTYHLKKQLKMGDDRFFRASKGLQEKGYLFIENKGRNGVIWTTTQTPIKENAFNDFSRDEIIANYNPIRTLELLERGTISKEQAKQWTAQYISALKSKLDFTEEEIIKIARHNWLDD